MSNPEQRSLFDRDDLTGETRSHTAPESQGEDVLPADGTASRGSSGKKSMDHEKLSGKTVYVIDSHSLIYQVFHAMPEMSSPAGEPTGATHGFVRDLLDIIDRRQPDYLFCAFDMSGPTFRHQLYDRYKETRDAMPDDLRQQIPRIKEVLATLRIPILEFQEYEADDILATLARIAEERGADCFLVTSDKDCRQLITDQVKMYNIRKDLVYDADALMQDWGIRPGQVVDFQSLVGDSVDCVPGVALIGPKIAKELLQQFGSLESILDHAEEVSGKKRRENLMAGREIALLSRKLVQLAADVPVDVDWDQGVVGGFDVDAAIGLCQELGFRGLTERIAGLSTVQAPKGWSAEYVTIETEEELRKVALELQNQERFVLDTETTSTSPRWAKIVGYSFSWETGKAVYVPVMAPRGDPQIDPALALEILRPALEDENSLKIGQNIKYDIVVLRGAGLALKGPLFDTMVADYLLDPGQRNHSIDDLAKRYLNHQTIKIVDLIGKGKSQKRMNEVPVELVAPYAAEDADIPLRLYENLRTQLEKENLDELFDQVEMPLIRVLSELEFNGITVDASRLKDLSHRLVELIDATEDEIFAIAGKRFNIDSRLQLASVLFDELKLPVIKKTKTGPSTDIEVLTELAKLHELPAKIADYRKYTKLKNTYVDTLPDLIFKETGRVHSSFMQDVAATGRLASKDPNLQNIPIRTDIGREIRGSFVPGHDDWRILTADYSQIELRVLAHFVQDQALTEAFLNDEDIHQRVASEVAGVPASEVTPEMRRQAKAINFGIIYGQSPFGLAKALAIPKEEAADFIERYFARYPGVDEFMEDVLAKARQNGYVTTILGRKRSVTGVRDALVRQGSRQRNLPERVAVNTVIQGSAADLIKLAMIKIYRQLADSGLRFAMLLQIHDELVFEVHRDDADELASLVNHCMSTVYELCVPLKVDVKVGEDWQQCEPISV